MRYLLLFLMAFGLVAQIPGTFRVTGPVAPPATNSNFGATDPIYGTGGYVTGLPLLSQYQEVLRYPLARRHLGMKFSLTTGTEYQLQGSNTNFVNVTSIYTNAGVGYNNQLLGNVVMEVVTGDQFTSDAFIASYDGVAAPDSYTMPKSWIKAGQPKFDTYLTNILAEPTLAVADGQGVDRGGIVLGDYWAGLWAYCSLSLDETNGANILYPDDITTNTTQGRWQFVTSTKTKKTVPTLANLLATDPRELATLYVGTNAPVSYVDVQGYYVPGDGGGGKYLLTNTVTGTNAYGGLIYSGLAGFSWLLSEGTYSAKQFGAVGDGSTDDTFAIQAALDFSDTIEINEGATFIASGLVVSEPKNIIGSGTLRNAASLGSLITVTNSATLNLSGVTIDGNKANRVLVGNAAELGSIVSASGTINVDRVSFTNTSRSAIFAQGNLTVNNSTFFSGDTWTATLGDTFYIFAQPNGASTNDEPAILVSGCKFTGDTNIANLHNQPAGIFVTAPNNQTNYALYRSLTVTDCDFLGTGSSTTAANYTGAIDTYNGCRNVKIAQCNIQWTPYSGLKLQRVQEGVVVNVTISDVANAVGNNTFAVDVSGEAREGASIFTGFRTNEIHYGVKISNVTIKRARRTAMVLNHRLLTVENCHIEDVYPSDASVAQVISFQQSNIQFRNNTLRNIPTQPIYFPSAVTNVVVEGNSYMEGSATNTAGYVIFMADAAQARIANNNITLNTASLGSGITVRGSTNVSVLNNTVINAVAAFDVRQNGSADPVGVAVAGNLAVSCSTDFSNTYVTNQGAWEFENSWNPTVSYGSAAPTTGTWKAGSVVRSTAPSSTTKIAGWICTVAGTPGTWETFGTVGPVPVINWDSSYRTAGIDSTPVANARAPLRVGRQTNELTHIQIDNIVASGSSAAAGVLLTTVDSSASIFATPSFYTASNLSDRLIFQPSSTAAGVTAYLPTTQVFDIVAGGSAETSRVLRGTNGAVLIGYAAGSAIEDSAVLQVDSTTKGFLPPRLTTVQRDAISSPDNGLILYNSNTDKLQVYAAGAWVDLH